MKKMTQIEALTLGMEAIKQTTKNEEAIAILEKMIMTKENQYNKAKAKRQEKSKANDKYIEKLENMLTEGVTIAKIKEDSDFKEFSTQKITSLLNKIKKEHELVITIEDGKKSYKFA